MDQNSARHRHRGAGRGFGLRPAPGVHHQIQRGVDSFHRGFSAPVDRTRDAVHAG